MSKTLLISLRSPFLDNDRVYPALANLYLRSAMNREGLETVVTDDWDKIGDGMREFSHVGVSIMTPQRELATEFLKRSRFHTNPGTVFIAGGPHARHYTDELRGSDWDYIVTHDGERVLPKIVKGEVKRRIVKDVITRKELDEMPRPDRLGEAEYLRGYNYVLNGRDSTTMLTARGCPERCTFCEDAMTPVLRTPIEKVQQELDDIVLLGYSGVYIFDDIFALAPKVTEPICREMQKRDLVYRCNGQARMMSEPFMKMLSETGCAEIAFGAETGSQTILDNIDKRTTVKQNYDFVKWCHKYEVPVKLFILLGLPGENWETLRETEDFVNWAGAADVQVAVYYPYKGTQIRDAIDRRDSLVDLTFEGEGLGAYGQKGGESEYVVGTSVLTSGDLRAFRDHLVRKYRPKSHSQPLESQRKEEDCFFNAETYEN